MTDDSAEPEVRSSLFPYRDEDVLRELVRMGRETTAALVVVPGLSVGSVTSALRRLDLDGYALATNRGHGRRLLWVATDKGREAVA